MVTLPKLSLLLSTLSFSRCWNEASTKLHGSSRNKRTHTFNKVRVTNKMRVTNKVRHCTDVLGYDGMGVLTYPRVLGNSSLSIEEEAVARVFSRDVCAFEIQDCIQPNRDYVVSRPSYLMTPQYNTRKYHRGKRITQLYSDADHSALPDIKQGSWGSCAFVVYSDVMLERKYGPKIDSHDTVVRIGLQSTSQHEAALGTKSHVIIVKPRHGRVVGIEAGGGIGDELRYYWIPSDAFTYGGPGRRRESEMRLKGEGVTPRLRMDVQLLHGFYDYTLNWNSTDGLLVPYPLSDQTNCLLESLFKNIGVPTSGMRFLTRLIKSHFCKKIAVFGFSGRRSGTVFNKAERMAEWHNPRFELTTLESWARESRGLLHVYT